MQLLTAAAIRQWDEYTIQNEPVSSIDLMERAAAKCVEWLDVNGFLPGAFHIPYPDQNKELAKPIFCDKRLNTEMKRYRSDCRRLNI